MDILDTSFSYLISINLSSLVPERNKSISPLPTPVSILMFVCLRIISVIVIDDKQDATFWYIYLFPISSTCFG